MCFYFSGFATIKETDMIIRSLKTKKKTKVLPIIRLNVDKTQDDRKELLKWSCFANSMVDKSIHTIFRSDFQAYTYTHI